MPSVDHVSSHAPPGRRAPGADRYRVQFTVGKETEDKLRKLQDLLRREIPRRGSRRHLRPCSRPFARGRGEEEARRDAEAETGARTPGSRTIPAHVRRAVARRDGGRCAFVARGGRRCTERTYLEFHHVRPYAQGGETTAENIALRCRAHNAYEAEVVFARRGSPRSPEIGLDFARTPL